MTTILLLGLALWLGLFLFSRWLSRRGWPDWHRDVLAAGLLALACVGYFWRILLGDAYMPADGGDLASFLFPTYRFVAESLRSGQWPLWNPHLYGGAPHVADIQAGFLYPPNLALFLLKPDFGFRAMEGLSILHFWWAGLGMYVFLRSLRWGGRWIGQRIERIEERNEQRIGERMGRPAALLGGLAFAFSDPLWVHFGNLNFIAVASWLPWVMACFVAALEGGRHQAPRTERWSPGWAAAGGVLLGIATLAGHIQATLFIGLAVVIYGLFWLFFTLRQQTFVDPSTSAATAGSPWPVLWRLVATIALLAAVACLVAAPVLVPALQLTGYTARADWSYQDTVGYSLSPAQWIGLLIPGFFGRGPQLHWGLWPRVEVGYLGILPLALAALALLARRERHTWTLAGLSAVSFLLALGIYSIVHGWLSLLPGFGLLRAPARFVLLVDFGLAGLAAVGLQVLLSPVSEGEHWKAITRLAGGLGWAAKATIAVVLPLTFGALLLAQDRDPTVYLRIGVAAIGVLLFTAFLLSSWGLVAARKNGWARPDIVAVLALLLVFLDLASTGAYNDLSSQNPARGFDQPEIAAFLAQEAEPFRVDARTDIDQLWQPNTALLYGLDDVWGVVNPSVLAPYERYWEGMGSRSSRLYDFLNARYVIGRKDVVLDWDKFELAFEGDPDLNVYRNSSALPRAFVVHQAQVFTGPGSDDQAWAAIHAAAFDPASQVVVEGTTMPLSGESPTADADAEPVRWLERRNNELVLEVTAAAPGYLVMSEAWYPGWRAELERDGQRTRVPVLRANTAFRAVLLEQPGTYRVQMVFAPGGWWLGLVLSGLVLMALAIWAFLARRSSGSTG